MKGPSMTFDLSQPGEGDTPSPRSRFALPLTRDVPHRDSARPPQDAISRGGLAGRWGTICCWALWLATLLAALLASMGCASFALRDIAPGTPVALPADHGPHDTAQTEWWHVHASLQDMETGEPLHLFAAFVVQRTDLDRVAGLPGRLGGNPVHTAYVQLVTRERRWGADRVNVPDWPAARFAGQEGLDLRHGDWRIAWEGDELLLSVNAGRHDLELQLQPTAEPVFPGEEGLVEVPAGSRHLWVQLETMQVQGRWKDGHRLRWIEGSGFYKHQWGRIYHPDLDGFEWFSMDLSDEHSLVLAWLLDDQMRGVPGSLAWITNRRGGLVQLPVEQIRITPQRLWRSRRSGARWPVAWKVEGSGLDLEIVAQQDHLELWAFPAPVYAGPARASGSFLGQPVDVEAYVEQVGAGAPRLRRLFRSDAPPAAQPSLADRQTSQR